MQPTNYRGSDQSLEASELIVNPDGSIYHLKLRKEHVADTVILVGDQNRVARISQHFDRIEHQISNREFVTHTGTFQGKRITALSTGIGTDNVDIVINELDALFNIDFESRTLKSDHHALNLVRLGTSGALQEDIPVDSFVLSTHGLGFDGVMNFYAGEYSAEEQALASTFAEHCGWRSDMNPPYVVEGSSALASRIGEGMRHGVTATANGFYGPQGRILRLPTKLPDLNEKLTSFKHDDHRITNFEMETSALFGLSAMLGHEASTVCAIIANRLRREYSKDYKETVDKLILTLLDRLTS